MLSPFMCEFEHMDRMVGPRVSSVVEGIMCNLSMDVRLAKN